MESLIYFLLWAALFVVMMRFGCGAHVMGHGHRHSRRPEDASGSGGNVRWVPPRTDIDPVCGMNVETAKAKSAVHDGHVHYFCSTACRDKFEASPDTYVKVPNAPSHAEEHQHDPHH